MIRLDTWKYMLDGEITRHWSNTYYFSDDYLAGWQASYDGHDAIRNFVLRERELHFTPVHYSHVTAYNVSGDITDGMCMWPYEGTLTGFWAPWSGLCPWGYARRHVFTPITGRSRQLWIRGGLQNADITLTPGGRLLLPALAGWNNNFQTAIAGMMSFLPQNTWWLRHGTTHPGSAIYLNPVSWKCTGASLMNAIDRAQERYMGGGEDLYEEALHITEYAARFFSFALTFNTPTPHQWYVRTYFNDLLTFVGEVGGFAKSVGDMPMSSISSACCAGKRGRFVGAPGQTRTSSSSTSVSSPLSAGPPSGSTSSDCSTSCSRIVSRTARIPSRFHSWIFISQRA